MESIMQEGKYCLVCKTTYNLQNHHAIHGVANRKKSEQYGLKVWLCQPHHTGNNGVHFNKELDLYIKRRAQIAFEKKHTREEWHREFGKSFLDDLEGENYHE